MDYTVKGLLIPIPTKDPTLQPDFKITLSLNFTCFTFYLSAIQTHTLDIPLSGMTTGIVIKFINTNGCLSSANMFSCFNSISTYLHRAPNNIWHIWHVSRWSSLSANMFSCFNPIATNLPRIPTSTHFSANLVNIFLRQNTIIHIIGSRIHSHKIIFGIFSLRWFGRTVPFAGGPLVKLLGVSWEVICSKKTPATVPIPPTCGNNCKSYFS